MLVAQKVLGAVIVFNPTEDCNIEGGSAGAAHRVIEVAEQDSGLAFLTKGDNNSADDGCWITAGDINGYITALYKDTNPANGRLGEAVNGAQASRDQAWRAFQEADNAYEDYVGDWCYNYSCQSPYYQRALRLFNAREDAVDLYKKEQAIWECWTDFARSEVAYLGAWSLCGLTPVVGP